jgi:hypothetical protein
VRDGGGCGNPEERQSEYRKMMFRDQGPSTFNEEGMGLGEVHTPEAGGS